MKRNELHQLEPGTKVYFAKFEINAWTGHVVAEVHEAEIIEAPNAAYKMTRYRSRYGWQGCDDQHCFLTEAKARRELAKRVRNTAKSLAAMAATMSVLRA